MRVLVVLGEGGHTRQMLQLLDQLGSAYAYTYLIAVEDELSEGKIRLPGPVYRIGRPRSKVGGRTNSRPQAAWQTLPELPADLAAPAPDPPRRRVGQRAFDRRPGRPVG